MVPVWLVLVLVPNVHARIGLVDSWVCEVCKFLQRELRASHETRSGGLQCLWTYAVTLCRNVRLCCAAGAPLGGPVAGNTGGGRTARRALLSSRLLLLGRPPGGGAGAGGCAGGSGVSDIAAFGDVGAAVGDVGAAVGGGGSALAPHLQALFRVAAGGRLLGVSGVGDATCCCALWRVWASHAWMIDIRTVFVVSRCDKRVCGEKPYHICNTRKHQST